MKKKFLSMLAALLLICCLVSPVLGGGAKADAQLGYVTDLAGILTDSEISTLEAKAADIAALYNCGLYIITLDDYSKYSEGSGIYDYACGIYTSYELGIGSQQNGMLLLMSMSDRDYALAAYGSTAHAAFTDYGKDVISNEFCRDFARNDWYAGFCTYLEVSEEMLDSAQNGTPVDTNDTYYGYEDESRNIGGAIFAIIFFPGMISLIICLGMKNKMKTAVQKTNANAYITPNGVSLYASLDRFTHITESRVHKETSPSGGGGTHINSSGFSGKSGKF